MRLKVQEGAPYEAFLHAGTHIWPAAASGRPNEGEMAAASVRKIGVCVPQHCLHSCLDAQANAHGLHCSHTPPPARYHARSV